MNEKGQPLRVAINAQVSPQSGAGGVSNVLRGLVHGLGHLDDGAEEYVIVGPWEAPDWLRPYLGDNQRIVSRPQPAQTPSANPDPSAGHAPTWIPGLMERLKRALGPLRPLAREVRRSLFPLPPPPPPGPPPRQWPEVPLSDGFYESLGCDVIHFPFQPFVVCARPTIYNPHDLQHLHYPQFFTPAEIAWRETIYPAGCHFAHTVVVASHWVKSDIIRHYRVDADKIQIIPWAPVTETDHEPNPDSLAAVQQRYRLEVPFALYPAMTWEHKNHIRLLEALALLRDRDGLRLRLVCPGFKHQFWPHIERRIAALGLQEDVKFVGLIPPEDLRALYRLAQFVVIPTLFEAASGPLREAWQDGAPTACSAVTSLPEQAGDAALLFDPLSIESIAEAVAQMATQPDLREDLRRRGARRLQDFSWRRTATAYRAVYRRAAGRRLSEEDRWFLSWDWMREPRREEEARR